MHEYSLVLALLDQVAAHVAAHPGAAVRRVELRVGDQAGVVPELLETAFEVAREHTPAAHAELVIERVPARWACPRCTREVAGDGPLVCGACGEPACLVAGDELDLLRLELEVP